MTTIRVIRSLVLAASVLAVAACATEPNTTLLDKKFERAAATYQKFEVQGQAVYCKKGGPSNISRLPGWRCLTEPQLREEIRSFESRRNEVAYNRNITKGG